MLPEAVGETGESEDWEGGFVSCAVFRWECFGSLRCWSRAFGVAYHCGSGCWKTFGVLFVSARSSSGGYCCFDWFEVRALRESWWLVVPGAEVEVVN